MELMIDRRVSAILQHVVEWPKVPQSSFQNVEVDKQPETDDQHKTLSQIQSAQPPLAEQKATQELETINTKATHILNATEAPKSQAAERPWLKLGRRFTLIKPSWPNPQLSLGTKCTRLGGNECWEATGPAQELFVQISKSLGDLLDARIDDLEEGEPVAGNILTFGMYMIGKGPDTARPTLLFTCQSQNPRRRAIKFVKESAILKGHPKIALAESSMCPLAAERQYLRLLSTLSIPSQGQRGPPNPMSRRDLSSGEVVGLGVGLGLGVTGLIIALLVWLYVRHNKALQTAAKISSRAWTPPPFLDPSPKILQAQSPWTVRESDFSDTIYEMSQSSSHPYVAPEVELSVNPSTMREIYRPLPAPSTVAITPRVPSGEPLELAATGPVLGMPIERREAALFLNQSWQDIQPRSDDSLLAHMYGTPIVCPLTGKRATIGGVIYLKGLYDNYLTLTVGHVFEGLFQSIMVNNAPVPLEYQDRDFEFSFAHEDEEELGEIDVAAVTLTTQASILSSASLSHTRTTNHTSSRARNENQPSNIDTAVVCNEQHGSTNITPTSPTRVMRPAESSISGSQLGLDWALIWLSQPTISNIGMNSKSRSLENVVLPRRVVPNLEKEADIVVVTGYSGIVKGKISLSTTMMRLSQRSKFQEVWTVRLDSTLVEGDSGSWVLNALSGDLYGHVVAGIPGSYIVYIIPAYKVFEDIERVVGDTVELDFGLIA